MRVADDVVARRVDDAVVLVNLANDQIYSLNLTGGRYWELVAEGRPLDEIVAALTDEFEVEASAVRLEIEQLTPELVRNGLIVVDDD